jgi:AraC-like DNA-binding protein
LKCGKETVDMTTELLVTNAHSYDKLTQWGDCVTQTLVNLDFSSARRNFSGSYRYLSSDDCVVARLFGTAHGTLRSKRKVREVDSDFVLLLHLKSGPATVTHNHFDDVVPAGSFLALDGSRPHGLYMESDFEHLALKMPRARFLSLHPTISSLTDRPLIGHSEEGSAAARIFDMIASFGGAMPSTVSTMSDTVVKLLGDWILREGGASGEKAIRHNLLAQRVLKGIDENFTDPGFSALHLALVLGISRRYVDSILAELGTTFGRALLEKRLERCHRLLTAPSQINRSVTDIAFESGFNDLSHFSKRFRERYGYSSREARRSLSLN